MDGVLNHLTAAAPIYLAGPTDRSSVTVEGIVSYPIAKSSALLLRRDPGGSAMERILDYLVAPSTPLRIGDGRSNREGRSVRISSKRSGCPYGISARNRASGGVCTLASKIHGGQREHAPARACRCPLGIEFVSVRFRGSGPTSSRLASHLPTWPTTRPTEPVVSSVRPGEIVIKCSDIW